jgi:predicted nucleotidyltransferase
VLNSDFNEDSDIDILVEFEPGHTPGLLLIRMQDELSTLFGGRKVDLVTRKFLNRRILNGLKTEVIVQHGQK